MFERKSEPRAAATLTLGAVRAKLIANGYTPVPLLAPDGAHPALVSEFLPALRTLGANTLAALILTPPEDTTLNSRIRAVLERRGLTGGPVRVGSDGRELWPLRGELLARSALDGAVELICAHSRGMGSGLEGALIPLDGAWARGNLHEIPYRALPALSSADAAELFEEVDALPRRIAEERRPPPKPSRRAFLGGP